MGHLVRVVVVAGRVRMRSTTEMPRAANSIYPPTLDLLPLDIEPGRESFRTVLIVKKNAQSEPKGKSRFQYLIINDLGCVVAAEFVVLFSH